MIALPKSEPYISTEEYLSMEVESPFRHEFVGGVMYAMAGASDAHVIINRNLAGHLFISLQGARCESFGSDMKLRVSEPGEEEVDYYYPDAMVCCDSSDGGQTSGHAWRERPSVLFEVLSSSTRLLDENSKRVAYLALPTLDAYVRLEQHRPEAVVERRTTSGWEAERVAGLDAVIRLNTVGVELRLANLYKGVKFPR